jgi:hypothetical protein
MSAKFTLVSSLGLVVFLLALSLANPSEAATPAPCEWHNVSAESPAFDSLYGIHAIGANDLWSVGSSESDTLHPLRSHSDGSQWNVVPGPNIHGGLFDVDGMASDDVWAVGVEINPSNSLTHIEHWNGSSWTTVPSPNPGTSDNYLLDIEAVAVDDIWAVGYYRSFSAGGALIEHYDGVSWSVLPAPASLDIGSAIAAVSANDIWLAGSLSSSDIDSGIEHWNGSSWTSVPIPPGPRPYRELHALSAVSANDVWAVGDAGSVGSGLAFSAADPYLLHWNGSSWTSIATSGLDTFNIIQGVSAISADSAWVVGYSTHSNSFSSIATSLVGYWDGSSWSLEYGSASAFPARDLNDVVSLGLANVWAVGGHGSGYAGSPPYTAKALVQHCVAPGAVGGTVVMTTPAQSG